MREKRGTTPREVQTQSSMRNHVARGWTGTERLSAMWKGLYTSRARKPLILWSPPPSLREFLAFFHFYSTHAFRISESFPKPHKLAFDHIHPTSGQALGSPPRTAILYASFQSTNFRQLHSHLLRLSSGPSPRVQYIFRPIPPEGAVGEKGYLSGYGVTLDLKKMDYLALDDRRSHGRSTFRCHYPLRLCSHAKRY